MSYALAEALRTAGFDELVSLDMPNGRCVIVYRSRHDSRVLLHQDMAWRGSAIGVTYALADDDVPAPDTIAAATALLAAPAPENRFASIDELAVALTRRDRLSRRAAARATETAGAAS